MHCDERLHLVLGMMSGYPMCCIREYIRMLRCGNFDGPRNPDAWHRCCPDHMTTPFRYDRCRKCSWVQVAGDAVCRRCQVVYYLEDLAQAEVPLVVAP